MSNPVEPEQTTVLRHADRFVTDGPGTTTWSVLSTGAHWDPARTAVGPLVALDEHLLAPGAGFPAHRHRGLDVVTAVLAGELHHDGPGRTVLAAGGTAVLHAGAGVEHSEVAGPGGCRFVQAWLLAEPEGAASYEQGVPALLRGPARLDSALAVLVVEGDVRAAGHVLGPGDTALRAVAVELRPGACAVVLPTGPATAGVSR